MLSLVGGGLVIRSLFGFTETPSPVFEPRGEPLGKSPEVVFGVDLPPTKTLVNDYHVYQSFNNCGPAALSMALSYYGLKLSQEALMADLRPYNNPRGKNDNKSTVPAELAARAEAEGLIAYFRPAGDLDLIKTFIANDFPVIVRTLLYPDQDYAHYRVIKGYGEGFIVQDDSLEGKNLKFSDQEFLKLWQPFNYAYLVLVSPEDQALVEEILGENLDETTAWRRAVRRAEAELASDPNSLAAQFNLAVAHYYLGDYPAATAAFERAESRLTHHWLWYQIEPIKAYFALGEDEKVLAWAERILNDGNPAYVDLYLLRGRIYLKRGQVDLARAEFKQALFYNVNSREAREALIRAAE